MVLKQDGASNDEAVIPTKVVLQTTVEQCPITPRPLPNEIIHLILGHVADDVATLYTCVFVTKQFSPIAIAFLWRAPNLRDTTTSFPFIDSLMRASPQRQAILGRYILRLQLDSKRWYVEDLTKLLPHVPLLTHFTIDGFQATETPIQLLALHCHHLTTLVIELEDLTEECFVALGEHCPQLCDLEWRVKPGQPAVWLQHLQSPLQRLRLESYEQVLDDEDIATIQSLGQLRCLEVFQEIPEPLTHFLDGSHWLHLTKLSLGLCSTIPAHVWVRFLILHTSLELLDLDSIDTWTSHTLPAAHPRLKHLFLHGNSNISSHHLRTYLQRCTTPLDSIHLCAFGRVAVDDIPGAIIKEDGTLNEDGFYLGKQVIENIKKGL